MSESPPPPSSKRHCPYVDSNCKSKCNSGQNGIHALGTDHVVEAPRSVRVGPKRRVALLMGYCGSGYFGMQVNPNTRTIESELFTALARAGFVSEDNACDIRKISFQRAARTDKGVHAVGQVVDARLTLPPASQGVALADHLNSHLPDKIRVWDIVPVTGSFDSKRLCDSRVYEYLMPTYLFAPIAQQDEPSSCSCSSSSSAPCTNTTCTQPDRAYRMSPEDLLRLQNMLAQYIGTHCFHNFTSGRDFKDPSGKRYIISFAAGSPFIPADPSKALANAGEWISLKVRGQSFMLHQIRKMVGTVVVAMKTMSPTSIVGAVLRHGTRLCVPKAPGLGLLLDRCVYTTYNSKVCDMDDRPAIDFDAYKDTIAPFVKEHIHSPIVGKELETAEFQSWIDTVMQNPDDLRYFTASGAIPSDYAVAERLPRTSSCNGGAPEPVAEQNTAV